MTEFRRVALRTGVALNVQLAGKRGAPPLILLHGFPESHRAWRELVPRLEDNFFLVVPDQRGYGGSDRPAGAKSYAGAKLVEDLFALADALGIERFALAGHDFGGVVAWSAAMRGDPRLERLAILNAPHPAIFQKSLFEHRGQRAASSYIRLLRSGFAEKAIRAIGFDAFFERAIGANAGEAKILEDERQAYIAEWSQPGALTAMANWYRSSKLVFPPLRLPMPGFLARAWPKIAVPTLVIWGMRDTALLPVQLDGLDALVEDLEVARLPENGHFIPWEAPDAVAEALRAFLSRGGASRASRA